MNSTESRLIDALLDLWAESPTEAVSVRALVQKAETAHSSIHYHFGNVEHLYQSASGAALAKAEHWMEAQLAALGTLAVDPLPPALQASIMASVIADWTGDQRRLAMAWRHAPGADWQTAWERFWGEVARVIGLGDNADTIACFAAGEAARHLLVWHPLLDRALLEETTAALVLWLRERRLQPDPVRAMYRTRALRHYHAPRPHLDRLNDPISAAAAALLAEQGHVGVTFRAVAARAQVTLGKVIHVYGTKSELLHAALYSLYEREALRGDVEQLVARTIAPDVMLDELLNAVLRGRQPVLAAYDEIERAIYNGEDHAPLRGLVRAMEDPSGTWALAQLLGGLHPSASLVAAFSATIRGIGYRVQHAGGTQDDLRSGAAAVLRPFAR
ncbi:MAG: TetR/AcrR family transcriptional regulator [Porphyrobacter sp. IPPAS B-1204]|nr:MAG: TetR/AcrR family transcriptional regulator [Porphyrobacter sp. IPPAS B-1204]